MVSCGTTGQRPIICPPTPTRIIPSDFKRLDEHSCARGEKARDAVKDPAYLLNDDNGKTDSSACCDRAHQILSDRV